MHVDPIKPTLKAPGTRLLKLKCDILVSTSAFKFNLRRYNKPGADDVVVVYSRQHQRAALGRRLFNDAGLEQCLALSEGVMGWRGGGGGGGGVLAYQVGALARTLNPNP